MADVHTLGKILEKLEELSVGQKKLADGHKELERRVSSAISCAMAGADEGTVQMEALSVPPSPAHGPAEYQTQYRSRSSMSGGVDALNEGVPVSRDHRTSADSLPPGQPAASRSRALTRQPTLAA